MYLICLYLYFSIEILTDILPTIEDREDFGEQLKIWSTGAHLPANRRSDDAVERNRVPIGESLHRKAWNQVKSKDNSRPICLFVIERIMQSMGVYDLDHLPEVSTKDGIDTFHVQNYTYCDLALTITYLLLGKYLLDILSVYLILTYIYLFVKV